MIKGDLMKKFLKQLCEERSLSVENLIKMTGLDEKIILATFYGRWTPTKEERDKISSVFGLHRHQICWEHVNIIDHANAT